MKHFTILLFVIALVVPCLSGTTQYKYAGKATRPDLDGLQSEIFSSAMSDTDLHCINWHQKTSTITVMMHDSISGADKTALDSIVSGY